MDIGTRIEIETAKGFVEHQRKVLEQKGEALEYAKADYSASLAELQRCQDHLFSLMQEAMKQ